MTLSAPPRAPSPPPRALPARRSAGNVARGIARGTGELLLTLGAVVLMFVAWQLWGTGVATSQAQDALGRQLDRQWSGAAAGPGTTGAARPTPARPTPPRQGAAVQPGPPVPAPAEGDALLRLHIPAIDVDWVVLEGVQLPDLADGPGHYPGSAMPGQVGNFAVAGHRTTHGAPFFRIAELRAGDTVEAEVADLVHSYRVTSHDIVQPGAVEVVAPVPGRPGVEPTQRLLTLTSCNPRYSASQRYVVHAELISTRTR